MFSLSRLFLLSLAPGIAMAQGTQADYQRAWSLRESFAGLTVNVPGPANWIGTTSRFWYRKSVRGGHEFVLVDAATQARRPAFDHARLAASLSAAGGQQYKPVTLPFAEFTFADDERAVEFAAAGS